MIGTGVRRRRHLALAARTSPPRSQVVNLGLGSRYAKAKNQYCKGSQAGAEGEEAWEFIWPAAGRRRSATEEIEDRIGHGMGSEFDSVSPRESPFQFFFS